VGVVVGRHFILLGCVATLAIAAEVEGVAHGSLNRVRHKGRVSQSVPHVAHAPDPRRLRALVNLLGGIQYLIGVFRPGLIQVLRLLVVRSVEEVGGARVELVGVPEGGSVELLPTLGVGEGVEVDALLIEDILEVALEAEALADQVMVFSAARELLEAVHAHKAKHSDKDPSEERQEPADDDILLVLNLSHASLLACLLLLALPDDCGLTLPLDAPLHLLIRGRQLKILFQLLEPLLPRESCRHRVSAK